MNNTSSLNAPGWAQAWWHRIPLLPNFSRESSRAHRRLFIFQILLIVSVAVCVYLDSPRPPDPVGEFFKFWEARGIFPATTLEFIVTLLWALWDVKAFFVIALAGFLTALWSGTLFFQALYDVNGTKAALEHYLNLLFGLGYWTGLWSTVRGFLTGTLFAHLLAQALGFGGYRYFVIKNGAIRKDDAEHPVIRVGGPAFLVIYNDSTAVLERDGCSTRVVGPGFAFLEPFEIIREVVDLRPQMRLKNEERVRAVTRDGIPIQVDLEVEFMIQPGPRRRNNPLAMPYPYLERAVRRAVYNKAVARDQTYFWKDLVLHRARFELRRLLNNYVLDRLIEPEEGDPREPLAFRDTPRREIQKELRRRLGTRVFDPAHEGGEPNVSAVKDIGVTVLRVTLGKLSIESKFAEAREEISKHRIESWKAEWIKRKTILEAEGEAAKTRLNETARAQAQAEMIQAIARALEASDLAKVANPSHILALRTIEALEQMALDPWGQIFVPEETLATLERLRVLFA